MALPPGGPIETFLVALRLGLTSFGGPVAHIGYFREEYVRRRRWLDDAAFADVVTLSQVLPGPASTQAGIAIGALRAGVPGALAAWLGFTLPSAVLLVAFAELVERTAPGDQGWLRGIGAVAVAVVLYAVLALWRSVCVDWPRRAIAATAVGIALVWVGVGGQLLAIGLAALAGALLPAVRAGGLRPVLVSPIGRRTGFAAFGVLLALLAALPAVRALTDTHAVATADSYFRTGALVFGGGHVVLPLLHAEVVEGGWVDEDEFVAGYGAAQAVPGPLFTFAGYLGAISGPEPNGVAGGALALAAIFAPSFLIVACALPALGWLRRRPRLAAALAGAGAGVAGLLVAAFLDPVLTEGISGPADVGIAGAAFVLLAARILPPWAIVGLCAGAGALVGAAG